MVRVGQCECCEAWLLARSMKPARVTRPTLAARERIAEHSPAIPGLDEGPSLVYFCAECYSAIREEASGEEPRILRPGDPEFATAAVGSA